MIATARLPENSQSAQHILPHELVLELESPVAQSTGGEHASHTVINQVVIPVCVAIVLALFIGLLVRWIIKLRRSSRARAARTVLPTVAEKPELFDVQLESPPPVYTANARWTHIRPLSAKYIPQDLYDIEQAVAANMSSYPGTPASSRPVSMQTSSSHSSSASKGSKPGEDGRLRVAVAIAMPSPRLPADDKKGKEASQEPPPLYLGVANLPWQATKLEA
ncbi:hypothetical protein EVJ58_g6600 [Rhodofomes roseus]|uniref:Uncharacterized protein n=1 Tax=Rhodofomes roseus TaxID=34475 RepID=A0A4Y9Y719_9APHY|nr:hypothetical protein EVJ58_g6600 [Rhodofomes roseus]